MKILSSFLKKNCLFLLLSMMTFGYNYMTAAMQQVPQGPLFILCFEDNQLNQQMKTLVVRWWENGGLAKAFELAPDQSAAAYFANMSSMQLKDNNFEIGKPDWKWSWGTWQLNDTALNDFVEFIKTVGRPIIIIAGYTQASSYFVEEATKKLGKNSIHSIILLDPSVYKEWNFNAVTDRLYNFYTKSSGASIRKIGPTYGTNGFVNVGDGRLQSKVVNILCEQPDGKVINFFEKNGISKWLRDMPFVGLMKQINTTYLLNADLKAEASYDAKYNMVVRLMINRPWELECPSNIDCNNPDRRAYFGYIKNQTEKWTEPAKELATLGTDGNTLFAQIENEKSIKNDPIHITLISVDELAEKWEESGGTSTTSLPVSTVTQPVSSSSSSSSSSSAPSAPIATVPEEEAVVWMTPTQSVSTVTPLVSIVPTTTSLVSTPSQEEPKLDKGKEKAEEPQIVAETSVPVVPPSVSTVPTVQSLFFSVKKAEPINGLSSVNTTISLDDFMKLLPVGLEEQEMNPNLKIIVPFTTLTTLINQYKGRCENITLKDDELYIQKRTLDNVQSKICFIGDIHGSVTSVVKILNDLKNKGFIDKNFKIIKNDFYMVFKGDYADRGLYGAEVWYLLLRLKLAQGNWNNVYLLRGNHEAIATNMNYGFAKEIMSKYGQGLDVFGGLYNLLPQALCIGYGNNWGLACHAGLNDGIRDTIKSFIAKDDDIKVLSVKQWNFVSQDNDLIRECTMRILGIEALNPLNQVAQIVSDIRKNFENGPFDTSVTPFLWSNILYQNDSFVFSAADRGLPLKVLENCNQPAVWRGNLWNDPKGWLAVAGLKVVFKAHQHYFDGLKMISKDKYEKVNKKFLGYPISWKEFVKNPTDPILIDNVECPIFTFTTARLKRGKELLNKLALQTVVRDYVKQQTLDKAQAMIKEFGPDKVQELFKARAQKYLASHAQSEEFNEFPLATDVFYGIVTTDKDFAQWTLTPCPIDGQTTAAPSFSTMTTSASSSTTD